MRGTTHMAGGLLVAGMYIASMQTKLDPAAYAAILGGALLGSLAPDIDHPNSKIANKNGATKVMAVGLNLALGHRGIIHTPFCCILTTMLLYWCTPGIMSIFHILPDLVHVFSIAFGLGFLSHLILDTFNPGGIKWLLPFSHSQLSLGRIYTNSLGDWAVFALLLVLSALVWKSYSLYIPGVFQNITI